MAENDNVKIAWIGFYGAIVSAIVSGLFVIGTKFFENHSNNPANNIDKATEKQVEAPTMKEYQPVSPPTIHRLSLPPPPEPKRSKAVRFSDLPTCGLSSYIEWLGTERCRYYIYEQVEFGDIRFNTSVTFYSDKTCSEFDLEKFSTELDDIFIRSDGCYTDFRLSRLGYEQPICLYHFNSKKFGYIAFNKNLRIRCYDSDPPTR